MAHRAERYLPVEEAHRVAHVVVVDWTYQRSGFALEAEIKGLLCRYATIRDSYLRQAHGIGKSQRHATNGGNFIERMVNTKEEVKTTPNELEVFTKARETMLLAEHEAGEDPYGDPAGTHILLRRREAATSAHISPYRRHTGHQPKGR